MVKFDRIYESEQVSVLLILSTYNTGYTATDYNPLPSISFPINGGFRYRSGRFNCIADTNVVLIEKGNIEFDVIKFKEFNHDRTLSFQIRGKDFLPFHKIFQRENAAQTLKRNPQIEILVRLFLSIYPNCSKLLKDQIIEELLIDNILAQKLPATRITKFTPWNSRKINIAKDYIFNHSSEDISLDNISAVSNISSFHFSRIFKKVTGYSPYAYLLQVRIVQAQQLLREGSSVTSTAFEVGFNSVANFSYRFKEMVGISPSEYQKSNNSKVH